MKRTLGLVSIVVLLLVGQVRAQTPAHAAVHSHTSAATLTIPAPGVNQFVYVTGIDISNCAGALAVVALAPSYITTTNITGSPQYQIGSGVTAGQCQPQIVQFTTPLRATSADVEVTFVLPTFAVNQTLSVNVYYFYGGAF